LNDSRGERPTDLSAGAGRAVLFASAPARELATCLGEDLRVSVFDPAPAAATPLLAAGLAAEVTAAALLLLAIPK